MSRAVPFDPATAPPVTPPRRVIQEGDEGSAWRAQIERRVAALEAAAGIAARPDPAGPSATADARLEAMLRAIDPDGRVPVEVHHPVEVDHGARFTVQPDTGGRVLLTYLGNMAWTLSLAEAGALAAQLRRCVTQQQGAAAPAGEPG